MRAPRAFRFLACAVLVAAVVGVPKRVVAQQDDDAWVARCQDNQGWHHRRVTHCEARVSGFKARPGVLSVDPGTNGGVEVIGWDRDSVEVHARIQTQDRSDQAAADLAHEIHVTTNGLTIGAEGPRSDRDASWSVSFVVYVPRKTDLSLDTYNGPLAVRDVSGQMRLSAENGPVDLDNVAGDVQARTRNGPLSITLSGERWDGQGLDAETTNGPVDLYVPRGYNAQLEFGTENGPMNVGFPVQATIQGHLTRHISTTLGSGGPTVRATTTNGPFELRRH